MKTMLRTEAQIYLGSPGTWAAPDSSKLIFTTSRWVPRALPLQGISPFLRHLMSEASLSFTQRREQFCTHCSAGFLLHVIICPANMVVTQQRGAE